MGSIVPPNDNPPAHTVADLAELGRHFNEYQPRLLAMLQRRIDPKLAVRLDPEDILSETYLEARRRWPDFKSTSDLSPYAWLFGIARGRLIETWRRHTRGPRDLHRELPWPDHSSVLMGLSLVDPALTPGAAAVREETRSRMQQALALLKHADREILWLRQYDGLSFREAGAVLDLSENAATVRYLRALKKLRQLWEQLYGAGGSVG